MNAKTNEAVGRRSTKADRRAAARNTKPNTKRVKTIEESSRPRAKQISEAERQRRIELLPKNPAQARYIDALYSEGKDVIFATGPAGTGKTYLPSLYAIRELKDAGYKRIVITRPVVPNGEDLGFLPGDIIEKMGPWVRPIFDTFQEVMSKQEIESLIERGTLEISPLAYMRGRTFKNAFIIADEMQNATKEQLKMLLTRIGEGSRMVITGDLEQRDRIGGECGLLHFMEELTRLSVKHRQRISLVNFNQNDVERHPIIKDILAIYGDY